VDEMPEEQNYYFQPNKFIKHIALVLLFLIVIFLVDQDLEKINVFSDSWTHESLALFTLMIGFSCCLGIVIYFTKNSNHDLTKPAITFSADGVDCKVDQVGPALTIGWRYVDSITPVDFEMHPTAGILLGIKDADTFIGTLDGDDVQKRIRRYLKDHKGCFYYSPAGLKDVTMDDFLGDFVYYSRISPSDPIEVEHFGALHKNYFKPSFKTMAIIGVASAACTVLAIMIWS
jgi:hypothetical protein